MLQRKDSSHSASSTMPAIMYDDKQSQTVSSIQIGKKSVRFSPDDDQVVDVCCSLSVPGTRPEELFWNQEEIANFREETKELATTALEGRKEQQALLVDTVDKAYLAAVEYVVAQQASQDVCYSSSDDDDYYYHSSSEFSTQKSICNDFPDDKLDKLAEILQPWSLGCGSSKLDPLRGLERFVNSNQKTARQVSVRNARRSVVTMSLRGDETEEISHFYVEYSTVAQVLARIQGAADALAASGDDGHERNKIKRTKSGRMVSGMLRRVRRLSKSGSSIVEDDNKRQRPKARRRRRSSTDLGGQQDYFG